MAAELCALNVLEYDGLPLAYYRDFAKQCWDEVRHAQFYLRLAVELLHDFMARAPAGHPLLPGARAFLATGKGLGVPREGNLYVVAWSAPLDERLVLMHLDTEAPAVPALRRELESPFCAKNPGIASDLALTLLDEAAHARIGKRWLAHLHPEPERRDAAIERARMLRGVYVAAALAAGAGLPLGEVIDRLRKPKASSSGAAGGR